MAKPFFPKDWETLTAEDLATARARLAGFIEAVPDREKVLREVTRILNVIRNFKCKSFTWKNCMSLTGHDRLHVTSHEPI